MPRRALVALLAPLLLAPGAEPTREPRAHTGQGAAARLPVPLPPRGHLSTRAHVLHGPRGMNDESTHGRSLDMHGNPDASRRVLVAGCVNGRRCAGEDVVNATMVGCPPPDAEYWLFATLDPDGADLDATPLHPGAAAWRQAVADLRPRTAIAFRTGPKPLVSAGGPSAGAARRYARLAGLPFRAGASHGLASWTSTVLPRTIAFTVELPSSRISAARASRLAFAIDRLAGTRFAAGGQQERLNMIRHGLDPRM